jgi:ketosteroid isomerase-like protein
MPTWNSTAGDFAHPTLTVSEVAGRRPDSRAKGEEEIDMPSRSKSDIIRSLFAAYKSKERKIVEELLTDDFTFTSPYDDAIDKATYFERCWPNSERIKTHLLEKIFVEGDEAFVLYQCITNEGNEFRNTEFFEFDGDKIKRVNVFFGANYKDGAFVKE